MPKDLKIGLVLGLAVVAACVLWLSTRPGLSTKARMLRINRAESPEETSTERLRFVTNLPNSPPAETTGGIEAEQNNSLKSRKFHIVSKGETLSDISQRYYGSSNKWQKILIANSSAIKDANRLKPGTKLIIPE